MIIDRVEPLLGMAQCAQRLPGPGAGYGVQIL